MLTKPEVAMPLKEQAYAQIKQLIISETVPQNGFLSERNLAAQLGMSKTPIRLAIARLEHEGFVRVSPQQGIVVVALSFEEILDFIEYRVALEGFVIRSLCQKIQPQQVKQLYAHLEQHNKLMKKTSDTREAQVYSDMAFHALLAQVNGNGQILQGLLRQQAMLYRVATRVFEKHPYRAAASLQEHLDLVALIEQRKTEAAFELIEKHILNIKTLLIGN